MDIEKLAGMVRRVLANMRLKKRIKERIADEVKNPRKYFPYNESQETIVKGRKIGQGWTG